MNTYTITFCWSLSLPANVVYKGEVKKISRRREISLQAESEKDLFRALRGTDLKTMSTMKVIKCIQ